MGRDATKAAGNPWYQARKKAAEYDDRLCSRESAAEQLGMSVSSLADAELGNTKFMPVDKAVLGDATGGVCGMKYQPVYKCPLCGRLLSRSQPQEVPTEMLPALLGKVIQHQQLAANPFTRNNVPMHIPCKCPDGSAGLAQFAGFRCVK